MERLVGTVVRGLRAPIIREGDNLEEIVVDTVLNAESAGEFTIRDRDILAITEAVVARAQGNYASVQQIATDVKKKLGGDTIGVVFPILSRNRFAVCLHGIARSCKKVVLVLSYPSDEVGNRLVDKDIDDTNVDCYRDVLTEEEFVKIFGKPRHTFTGVDYVSYYKEIIESEGASVEVIFSNNPRTVLEYTQDVLVCDIHSRHRSKRILKEAGARTVVGMDEILTESVDGSGYNTKYGILGSNTATEDTVKLFPNDCTNFVNRIQEIIEEKTGKRIEVMVYGDGAFKDPVGKIWELADPVVSPGYTKGLEGTPNEIKLKYLADNDFAHLKGDDLQTAIKEYIEKKDDNLGDSMAALGTTPRRLTDLIGSLCDLTSGSGDKGTPFIYIQGYFDNFTK
ncbi:MAG: coenzyme F420-0:L-glutamate ligase [Anaerovoracaceae bacterium]|jgi:F420-0:gamma-glutamyl ligase